MTDQQPQTPAVKPAGAEAIEKAKAILAKLPMAEKLAAGGGLLLLIGIYALDFVKTNASGTSSFLTDLSSYNSSTSFADNGGFWLFFGIVAAIAALVLPFIEMIAPKVKLPFPKAMIYFVAGIVGALAPVMKYMLTDNKSTSLYGITIKIVPDIGMYLMVAAGALIAYGGFQSGGMQQLMAFFGKAKTTPPAAPQA